MKGGRDSRPFLLVPRLGQVHHEEFHVGSVVEVQRRVATGVVVVEDGQRDPQHHRGRVAAVVIVVFVVTFVVSVLAFAAVVVVRVPPVTIVVVVVFVPALVVAFVLPWLVFGLVATVFDLGVHRTVDDVPFVGRRAWLILPMTLLLAGAYQLSAPKRRLLERCRTPTTRSPPWADIKPEKPCQTP